MLGRGTAWVPRTWALLGPYQPNAIVTFMIQIEQIGEVRKFRLARTMAGRGLYFTAAYWVDGLMVDTGCAYTVRELLESVDNFPVRCIVNTHSHEDHIAGNAALQAKFGADVSRRTRKPCRFSPSRGRGDCAHTSW